MLSLLSGGGGGTAPSSHAESACNINCLHQLYTEAVAPEVLASVPCMFELQI